MKVRSASSAQCRSSNTSTVVRSAARLSQKRRHAAKDSSSDAGSAGAPTRGASRARSQPRSGSVSGIFSASFAAASCGAVRLQDPALRLDDLAERPERDPVSVGEAATLAPAHESRPVLDLPQQLGAQPALADPGLADDRHELAGRLPRGTRERPAEDLPFELAPDHRRACGASHVRAEARAGPQWPPDHDRLRLALDRDGLQRLPFEDARRDAIGLVGRRRRRSPGRPPAGARRCSPRLRRRTPRPFQGERRA